MGFKIIREIRMILSFALTVVLAVLVLKLFSWLPSFFQKDDLRKYKSIEELRAGIKATEIFTPAYFPEHINWPPTDIFGQKKPFMLIMMFFPHKENNSPALSIYQFDSGSGYSPPPRGDVLYSKNRSIVKVKGREAEFVPAVCAGHIACNRLSWSQGRFSLTIISDDKPEEMIKIAESMIPAEMKP